jgi:hypothetical protein
MSGMFEYAARDRVNRHHGGPVDVEHGWAAWVAFAGCMLILLGLFHALMGLVALFHDEVFLVGKSALPISSLDYTAWGWLHIAGGVVAMLAGVAVQRGRTWARAVAVAVAFVSAVLNMTFLPAYPLWSAILIALDILIIWAVIVHGAVMKEPELVP